MSYHEHDSLLENKQEEELTEEERKKAWEEYNAPPAPPPPPPPNPQLTMMMAQNAAAQMQMMAQQFPLLAAQNGLPFGAAGNFPKGTDVGWLQQMALANAQRLANPFAARQQQNTSRLQQKHSSKLQKSLPNPFAGSQQLASNTYAEKLAIINRMTPQELLAIGQKIKVMPREGEGITIYRQRLAQFLMGFSNKNEK